MRPFHIKNKFLNKKIQKLINKVDQINHIREMLHRVLVRDYLFLKEIQE